MTGIRKLAAGILTVLLLVTSAVRAGRAETPEREITVLVYMTGSNLETLYGSATADLQEMENAGFDADRVGLLVMAGGSRGWHSLMTESQTVILRYFRRRGEIHSVIADRRDDLNMGEAESLSEFLEYGVRECPAKKYALILWDHGAGPVNGVCWDEHSEGDHLTMAEMEQALANSPFQQQKLAWIGFDACLMSSVEMAEMLSPYAEYMMASQAEEPASGWNYDFLKGLESDRDGAETGRRVVDAYFAASSANPEELTMACVKLDAVEEITARMDRMYRALAGRMNRETFLRLSLLRERATDFGRGISTSGDTTGYDLADLASLCDCFAGEDPEGTAEIREAIGRAVVHARSGREGCCGLSVYHPFRNQDRFLEEWGETYAGLAFCPGYEAYVNAYGKIMSGIPLVSWAGLEDIRAADQLVTLRLTEEQADSLASARLVVLAQNPYDFADQSFFRVFSTAEVRANGTMLSASYDGTCLQAVNEAGYDALTGALSYRVTEEGTYVIPVYPFGEDLQREREPVLAEYVPDENGVLRLKGYAVYDGMTGMLSRRVGIDLSRYSGVTFQNDYRNLTRNDAGEILAFDDWGEDSHRDTRWNARYDLDRTDFRMTFLLDSSHAEALYAAYEITDAQGNTRMSELVPLDGGGVTGYAADPDLADGAAGLSGAWYETPEKLAPADETANREAAGLPAEEETARTRVNSSAETGAMEEDDSGTGTEDREASGFSRLRLSLTALEEDQVIVQGAAVLRPAEAAENSRIIFTVLFRNQTEEELGFHVSGLEINGVPIPGEAAGSAWGGTADRSGGPGGITPGESGTAAIRLRFSDLEAIFPDVSLRQLSCRMTIFRFAEGKPEPIAVVPLRFRMEVPLEAFYGETAVLPSRMLVDAGQAFGALDAAKARTLFDLPECRLSLQGVFLTEGSMVLQLEAENKTEAGLSLYLGRAGMDRQDAVIGRQENVFTEIRNRRIRVYGLEKPVWESGKGVSMTLAPEKKRVFYVSAVPADDRKTWVRELSFEAFLYREEVPTDYVFVNSVRIRTEEAGPLQEGIEAIAEAGDYLIEGGQASEPRKASRISGEEFALPEDFPDPVPLEVVAEDGERIREGYVALFRRISSDEELAAMNILNISDETSGKPKADFRKEDAWLLQEGYFMLSPAENGERATAFWPGIRPAAVTDYGSLPLLFTVLSGGTDRMTLGQMGSHLSFTSEDFPGAVLSWGVGSVDLELDLKEGKGTAAGYRQVGEETSDLAGAALQRVRMISAKAGAPEIARFLNREAEGVSLHQVAHMGKGQIRFTVETVTDPENYAVAFLYVTEDGTLRCTEPVELTAFLKKARGTE